MGRMTRGWWIVVLLGGASALFGAEVFTIDEANYQDVAPQGKEADWIYGDCVIRNDLVTAVIGAPLPSRHANMTVRNVAGAVIDFTQRDRSNDQLSGYYPGAAKFAWRDWTHDVTDGVAEVHLTAEATEGLPQAELVYRLEDGQTHLHVRTRFHNTTDAPLKLVLRDAVRADRGFDHLLRWGGFACEDYWWRQSYALLPLGERELRPVADSLSRGRPILAYRDGDSDELELAPGATFELARLLIVGEHLLDLEAARAARQGESRTQLTVQIEDKNGQPVPAAHVRVRRGEQPAGQTISPVEGALRLPLSPGRYVLEVQKEGYGVSRTEVSVGTEAQEVYVQLNVPGLVAGLVTDAQGQAMPAKIQYFGKDVRDPYYGPDTKSTRVRNVQYTASGSFASALEPGVYDVIISRGPEYDAVFRTIEVSRGKTTNVLASLSRSVKTDGWVSTDFHSHSTPSGDNTSDQRGRVLNLLAEHIEFAPCTEHNRISSYLPHLQALQATAWMATCSGIEVTGSPLPVNHQNAFPMRYQPRTQDGGGPTTDENPVAQIERLALWDEDAEKLVQQNHPNLEQIWADRDLDGEQDEGFAKMLGYMDVVEVHPPADIFADPGEKTGAYRNVIVSWLRMLNKGYRIPGVVNTDAHYNFHGSGWLRNYLRSTTDDPTQVETLEMVRAAERGNVVMTNGPFLEVTASSAGRTAYPGEDLRAQDGRLSLEIRVQCPNWCDINRVQLIINGRRSSTHRFLRRKHPQLFSNNAVRFEHGIDLELSEDAHVIVATIGDGLRLGPVVGPNHSSDRPVALCNPIFVDVDGDGFQANGDLLDLPFPYKAP